MERTVRKELIEQAEKGKHIRKLISFATLILGAVLGAILPYYIDPVLKPIILPKVEQPSLD